jgi:ferredoxin
MLQSLVPALEDWEVPSAHIHFEAFGPASIKRKHTASITTDTQIMVTFATSGQQFPWDNTAGSLLDFAETNGIQVNSGCRSGGCGTCQTTLQSGEVAYGQAPDFDPVPGTCLLCTCTPKTHVTLEA